MLWTDLKFICWISDKYQALGSSEEIWYWLNASDCDCRGQGWKTSVISCDYSTEHLFVNIIYKLAINRNYAEFEDSVRKLVKTRYPVLAGIEEIVRLWPQQVCLYYTSILSSMWKIFYCFCKPKLFYIICNSCHYLLVSRILQELQHKTIQLEH